MLHNFWSTNFSLFFAAEFQADPTDISCKNWWKIRHYQKLCNPECPSIIREVFAKKSADIHESSQLIHYYLYTISILCSPFYLLRALYPNRTSVESRLDSAHKPWYTVLCRGAKFISSLSDGTITDGDLYLVR